jgi:hypothetical protein
MSEIDREGEIIQREAVWHDQARHVVNDTSRYRHISLSISIQ